MVHISASLLAADFARLGEEAQRAEQSGVDSLHFDMMDGHYVPNLALSPDHLYALRPYTNLPFHVHLELDNPDEILELFPPLKADLIIVCQNTLNDPRHTFARIRSQGSKVGLSLNPDETPDAFLDLFPELDLLLILGGFPGFGGQSMHTNTIARIVEARQHKEAMGHTLNIAVDGGVKLNNALALIQAGVDTLVIGTALFKAPEIGEVIANIREIAEGACPR